MTGAGSPAAGLDLPDEPLAVSILTGFLGSGKTTVLRHLLADPAMEETAVIVNEFGEVGLDHLLIETGTEDTVLLNSGCLCCTIRGDLVQTLRGLFKRRARRQVPAFRRVVVETTGLADPAPILHTLMTDPLVAQWFRLDGILTTVDAASGTATLDRHRESVKQAAVADRLLVTKLDICAPEAADALESRLRALNPTAPILRIAQGAVAPATLFNAGLYNPETKHPDVARWLKAEAYESPHAGHRHGHDINRHGDDIRAFCLTRDRPLDWTAFNDWIDMLIALYGADLLRIKGVLNVAGVDKPLVVHGVQHVFHPPVALEAWPDETRRSRLVFITRGLDPDIVEKSLASFGAERKTEEVCTDMTPSLAIGPRVRKSPFFDATVTAGVTHFSTYNHMYIPVSYGDAEAEYWRLVKGVALWDVACERQVEIAGPDAAALAQYLSPRDLSRCIPGQGKYVPLCDHAGRLINDPVLLKHDENRFWFSIADSDVLLWTRAVAAERGYDVEIREPDASPLAVQGPKAEAVVCDLFGDWPRSLKYFWFRETALEGIPLILARSGWSKQGGFELYLLDGTRGSELWNLVREAGRPYDIGPGAPNYIERVESGLLSYGADTDAETNPFEVNLGKFLDLKIEAEFVGKSALREIMRTGPKRGQVGLFLDGARIETNKNPWEVTLEGRSTGKATAAAYSPRLERNIAIALIDRAAADSEYALQVNTENGPRQAKVTGLPFC